MGDGARGKSGFGRSPAGSKAILIVEDERLLAWDIEETLRDHGFQEILATTSVQGARDLSQSASGRISLVVLDLKLDDGDASVLIDEFSGQDIPVLVVTGYGSFTHARAPVLHKPFSTKALLRAVDSLLFRNGQSPLSGLSCQPGLAYLPDTSQTGIHRCRTGCPDGHKTP